MPILRPLASALAVSALALGLAAPGARADETRHCDFELRLVPQNASQTWRSYSFKVFKTVSSITQVNQARRTARGLGIHCLETHWADRDRGTAPEACRDAPSVDFEGYPFATMRLDVTEALCSANPGVDGPIFFTLELNVSGNTGCHFGGSHDPVIIAADQRIDCTRAETADPVPLGPAEEPAPIGDGGGWDCVGAGCDGGEDEAEDPPDDALPATATYLPLPMVRLPGNDLYLVELDAPNWLLCRQACTEDARCGAWTYRAPTAASGPVCLIKSRAGVPVPDPCCRSGVKQ